MVPRLKSSWAVLAGWLVGACLGGQTGEPASDHCNSSAVPWRMSISGVSPEQLALAYQGGHLVKLHWSKDPVAVTEAVTLTLDSPEQSGTIDCRRDSLGVPVTLSLQTDDGTVIETEQGLLTAAPGMLQPATFWARGRRFVLAVTFSQAAGKVLVSGTLGSLVDAAVFADFSNHSDGVAGAGGI